MTSFPEHLESVPGPDLPTHHSPWAAWCVGRDYYIASELFDWPRNFPELSKKTNIDLVRDVSKDHLLTPPSLIQCSITLF